MTIAEVNWEKLTIAKESLQFENSPVTSINHWLAICPGICLKTAKKLNRCAFPPENLTLAPVQKPVLKNVLCANIYTVSDMFFAST